MGVLVAVMLFAWLISKAVSDAKLDHAYARRGEVSPRLAWKYGGREQARARVARYGFTGHLRDAWRDYWARRTDALVAARDARPVGAGRLRLRDRLAAGRDAVTRLMTPPPAPAPDPPMASAAGHVEHEQPPVATTAPEPTTDTTPPATADDPKPDTTPAPSAPPTNGGNPMTSGEVVNYETAIATLDGLIADVRGQIDAARFALDKMAEAEAAIDALQQTYQPTAEAARTKLDHEAALNLDGTTLGHAGTTVDALPPNEIDKLYDHFEMGKQLTQERLVQAEIALASLESERANIVAKYGDAHVTVAGNLGGDSRFLDSAGGSGQQPAPAIVG